ncbi:MAG: hypothetical protein EOO40_01540 [Deltaproteobacteria bacterium]|nr:MAG: hypothetical protein EOO40_01540 [Deltaproteobacteria bacterium]
MPQAPGQPRGHFLPCAQQCAARHSHHHARLDRAVYCVCFVLTGVVPYTELNVADPIAAGVAATQSSWLLLIVYVGTLAGLTFVLMMQIYGLPRILHAPA